MVVLEGGGGPRRSAGAVGIDPGLAFGMDLALTRADEAAQTLAWRIRSTLRAAGASANAPVKLETIGVWAIDWRDDTRRRLAILRGGVGTTPTPWGPGGLYLPTQARVAEGFGFGPLWDGYADLVGDEHLGPGLTGGGHAASAVSYGAQLDDLLLLRGIDDPVERAALVSEMLRHGGRIPTELVAQYQRTPFADALRIVDGLDIGPALTMVTLPADLVALADIPHGGTDEEWLDFGMGALGTAAGVVEVGGIVGTMAISAGIAGKTGAVASVVAVATGPVGLAFVAGVGVVTTAYAIYDNWDAISAWTSDALGTAGDAIEAADRWVEDRTDAIADALITGGNQLLESLELELDAAVAEVWGWTEETQVALRGAADDLAADLASLADVAHGLIDRAEPVHRSGGDTVNSWS